MRGQFVVGSWIIICCALCAGCDDELELEFEDIEETEQNLTSVVTPVGSGQHMNSPAGTKVVVGPGNKLHAVYEEAGQIKYVTSNDGAGWTAPVVVSAAPAYSPTIAVASDGTIGVAFMKVLGISKEIHYTWKSPQGVSWTPSFKITVNHQSGADFSPVGYPSMVALDTTMHLAWSNGSDLYYIGFAASRIGSLATAERFNPPTSPCGTTVRNRPAIAVSRRSANNNSPLVRVAFLEHFQTATNCDPSHFAWGVAERPANGSTWTHPHRFEVEDTSAYGASLSQAAIPTTGDFYVAVSYVVQGVGKTELHYENAWNADVFRSTTLTADQSIVDVSAQIVDCVPSIRYVLSNGYIGATSYRTGRWLGAQAAAPTWSHGPIQINAAGVNGEALFFRRSSGGYTRFVPAVYEQYINGASSIVEETTTAPFVPGPMCEDEMGKNQGKM